MVGNAYRRYIRKNVNAVLGLVVLAGMIGLTITVEEAKAQEKSEDWTLADVIKEVVALKNNLATIPELAVPVGTIMPYGGSMEKNKTSLEQRGWYYCDGESLNNKVFSELFAVIGTAFGMPDGEHFNLPDLRGRFVRGVDNKAGRDPDAGSRTCSESEDSRICGDKIGSVQKDAMQKHTHRVYHWHEGVSKNQKKGEELTNWPKTDRVGNLGAAIKHDEGGEPRLTSETRPKNIYVNWIIKAKNVADQ